MANYQVKQDRFTGRRRPWEGVNFRLHPAEEERSLDVMGWRPKDRKKATREGQRQHILQVVMSEAEYETVRRSSAASGQRMSPWARDRILAGIDVGVDKWGILRQSDDQVREAEAYYNRVHAETTYGEGE